MPIDRPILTLGFVSAISLFSAFSFTERSISGAHLADSTLARVVGTNGGQMGGASASYSCDDANAGSGQYSNASCTAATTVPNGSVCVRCPDVYASGYASGNTTPIVFSQAVNCGGTPPGSRKFTGSCVYEVALGHGVCEADTVNGNCSGSYNQFTAQPQQGDPGNPGSPTQ